MKGIIALDVDGTITEEFHSVPGPVVAYLHSLVDDGWKIIFITGRSYVWGQSVLKAMTFPFCLAVQNGAIILEMPSRKIINKKYLESSVFFEMDDICRGGPTDYVIYGGYEHDDVCFYRSTHFSKDLLAYLKRRAQDLGETYLDVVSYANFKLSSFPSIKCFGTRHEAEKIAEEIEGKLGLHVTPVRDPYDSNYFVVQATHAEATKGRALEVFKKYHGDKCFVVAAGNDYNDSSMFSLSDIKVVMSNSPSDILEIADVVAPPVSEMGIIAGLQEAIKRIELLKR